MNSKLILFLLIGFSAPVYSSYFNTKDLGKSKSLIAFCVGNSRTVGIKTYSAGPVGGSVLTILSGESYGEVVEKIPGIVVGDHGFHLFCCMAIKRKVEDAKCCCCYLGLPNGHYIDCYRVEAPVFCLGGCCFSSTDKMER
jgi:hypothetical protein